MKKNSLLKLSVLLCLVVCTACQKTEVSNAIQGKSKSTNRLDIHIEIDQQRIMKNEKKIDKNGTYLPVPASEMVEESYFNDAVFVGDSRVSGLGDYGVLKDTTMSVYAAESLDLNKVFLKDVIMLDDGTYGTLLNALNQHSYKKVYVSFGLNEMGWRVMSIFEEKYIELVEEIKKIQPEATIYLLSVYNYSEDHENEDDFTNLEKVNMINESIVKVAESCQVQWIHSNEMLGGDDQFLSREWSEDGYHLNSEGYIHWIDMLKQHALKG